MNEAVPEVTFDAPAKKKKVVKKAKPRAAVREKPSAPFPGLSRPTAASHGCADACNVNGCAISGTPRCAHPLKGGLAPELLNDQAAMKRMQAARDQLDVRLDPDRFK